MKAIFICHTNLPAEMHVLQECRSAATLHRSHQASVIVQGMHAGLLFAGMAVVGLVGIMPAAFVADHLGRKWTIVPSAVGLASAILIMANTGRASLFPGGLRLSQDQRSPDFALFQLHGPVG